MSTASHPYETGGQYLVDNSSSPLERETMRSQLKTLIEDWNANRLDLFSLTEPNEDLEFYGVMRFYYHEPGQKITTKCVRVSSTATTRAVVGALVEKFHSDLKMLANPAHYALFEVHENGQQRRLALDEKPLLVQLNWHKDDREGRFLLKNDTQPSDDKENEFSPNLNRKLSKREKKEKEKAQKLKNRTISCSRAKEFEDLKRKMLQENKESSSTTTTLKSSDLFNKLPPSNFTRTISNPEIVMKKRRERKLEQKLRDICEGGSLKIYGHDLSENKPYVTILVSVQDTVDKLIKESLEKYGLEWQDPSQFYLVEKLKLQNSIQERPLMDHERPLLTAGDDLSKGLLTFHIRRRSAGDSSLLAAPSRFLNSRSSQYHDDLDNNNDSPKLHFEPFESYPCLLDLSNDGKGKAYPLCNSLTVVGGEPELVRNGIYICGPKIFPNHCTLAYVDGMVTITPCSNQSSVYLNDRPTFDTTILRQNDKIRFGQSDKEFRFIFGNNKRREMIVDDENIYNVKNRRFSPDESRSRDVMSPVINELRTTLNHKSSSTSLYQSGVLPALIELSEYDETGFIATLFRRINSKNCPGYKLAPAYCIYMAIRGRFENRNFTEIDHKKLTEFLEKIIDCLHVTIQDSCHDGSNLTFWLSNCAELLNFFKMDSDLNQLTKNHVQDLLLTAVQKSYDHLAVCFKQDLHSVMPCVLQFTPKHENPTFEDQESVAQLLRCLSDRMTLLRQCHLNAAFTIQLFSQLLHYINMYLFNWLISREGLAYCCRRWGQRLRRRLALLDRWTERHGLELAAQCRLQRIEQTTILLESSKVSQHDLIYLKKVCTCLNSLQIRSILERYHNDPSDDEPAIRRDFIEIMVKHALETGDLNTINENRTIELEEELDLCLPFLLPDDGYSVDNFKGLPSDLREFIDFLVQRKCCNIVVNPNSDGLWSTHFGTASTLRNFQDVQDFSKLKILEISFEKINGGIGLSIVQAQSHNQGQPGIYVKKIVSNSAAEKDGRLQPGDQLLSINGQNLVGITQDLAAQLMAQSGPIVNFKIAQGAAYFNGLSSWMQQDNLEDETYNTTDVKQQNSVIVKNNRESIASSHTNQIISKNQQHYQRYASNPYYQNVQQLGKISDSTIISMPSKNINGQMSSSNRTEQSMFENHNNKLCQTLVSHSPSNSYDSKASLKHENLNVIQNVCHENLTTTTTSRCFNVQKSNLKQPTATTMDFYENEMDQIERLNKSLVLSDVHDDHETRKLSSKIDNHQTSYLKHDQKSQRFMTQNYQNLLDFKNKGNNSINDDSSNFTILSNNFNNKTDNIDFGREIFEKQKNIQTKSSTTTITIEKPSSSLIINNEPPPAAASLKNNQNFQPETTSDHCFQESETNVELEIERLLLDEIQRLGTRNFADLNENEKKRLRALKYELEYRKRLKNLDVEHLEISSSSINDQRSSSKASENGSLLKMENDECKSNDDVLKINVNTFVDDYKFVENFDNKFIAENDYVNIKSSNLLRSSALSSEDDNLQISPSISESKKYIFEPSTTTSTSENVPRAQVIGLQEIYKDPRQERLKSLQSKKMPHGEVETEKLSFQEKMKLFAKDLGENQQPKYRLKISSAQREIENSLNS